VALAVRKKGGEKNIGSTHKHSRDRAGGRLCIGYAEGEERVDGGGSKLVKNGQGSKSEASKKTNRPSPNKDQQGGKNQALGRRESDRSRTGEIGRRSEEQ